MPEIVKVQRTSHGLVDALFNTIDRLNGKEIDAEHARAIAHTARTIVSVAELELEFRRYADEKGGDGKLTSLAIESTK